MSVQKIQQLLIGKLAAALKADGFKHSGGTFYRQQGELIHIICLRGSKWNQGDDATYFVDLAVHYGPAFAIQYGQPLPSVPKEYESQLRKRLDGKGIPPSWEFLPGVDKLALADKLITAVKTQGLAYFEGVNTPLQLADHVMDKTKNEMITIAGHVSRAIIFSLLGDKPRAQTELDAYFHKNTRLNGKSPVTQSIKRQHLCIAQETGLKLSFPELNGETCVGFYIATKGKQLVNDERRTCRKLELFLRNLEGKGLGYRHYYGALRKPGAYRIGFCTKDPAYVVRYIQERQDKLAKPLQAIVANDEF